MCDTQRIRRRLRPYVLVAKHQPFFTEGCKVDPSSPLFPPFLKLVAKMRQQWSPVNQVGWKPFPVQIMNRVVVQKGRTRIKWVNFSVEVYWRSTAK